MKKWTAFLGTFILSYLFWILFLMQDFNILKLGTQELVVGLIVATIVAYFSSSFFAREDGFWIFKKFRLKSTGQCDFKISDTEVFVVGFFGTRKAKWKQRRHFGFCSVSFIITQSPPPISKKHKWKR